MKKIKVIPVKSKKNSFMILGTDMNLKDTFECGQCFRWNFKNGKWTGVAYGRVVIAEQCDNGFILENTTLEDIENIWLDYFDLETDYKKISGAFPNDMFIQKAAEYGKGIHILKQEPHEAIISFIISANNNIKRIKKIIEKFCLLYGKPIEYGDDIYYAFPSINDFDKITLDGLAEIRAGFRDKYIIDAVEILKNTPELIEKINNSDTEKAKKELLKIKGVGPKVCDCILLFGFSRYEVFPKDVWIKRVVNNIYGSEFDEAYLGEYAGVIQQYFFYYGRSNPELLEKIS